MAPLVRAFAAAPADFTSRICVTAQHREMLDQVLEVFDITPDYDLDIMKDRQDLYDITAKVLVGMREVLKDFQPDLVLVHGDTTTTLATSLAAFYQRIPVGHVEAGLRTWDKYAPWPEEINRQVTSRIATFHFAPTPQARENLIHEQVPQGDIWVTGNTVIDALHLALAKIERSATLKTALEQELAAAIHAPAFQLGQSAFVLITGHRRENFGDGFDQICQAISELATAYPEVHFVYPVHLNPQVQGPVHEWLGGIANIHLCAPLSYLPFIYLMSQAYIVLTDSGGIQEEAPSLGKPVLVMRDTTERPEAVTAGTVRLVGANRERIVAEVSRLLDDPAHHQRMSAAQNPYGDGLAAGRILEVLRGR